MSFKQPHDISVDNAFQILKYNKRLLFFNCTVHFDNIVLRAVLCRKNIA